MAKADVESGISLDSIPFLKGLNAAGDSVAKFVSKSASAVSGLSVIIGGLGRVYNAGMRAAKVLLTVGIAIAAIASVITVKAVKAFAEFQRAMQEIASLIPEMLVSQIQALGDAILALSREFGQAAASMTRAAYNLTSAVFSTAETLIILRSSSVAAVAGLTEIQTAARISAAVLRAYGMTVASIDDIQDSLFMTVKLGVLTFQELADNLGTVLPIAAATGVSIDELGAILARTTQMGIPANEAVTALNRLLTQLAAPTETLSKRMKELGIVTLDAYNRFLPVEVVLKRLQGLTPVDLRSIVGEMRASKQVFAVLQDLDALFAALDLYGKKSGSAAEAFGKQTETISHKWKQMAATFRSVWITIGAALEPVGQSFIRVLAEMGSKLLSWVQGNSAHIRALATIVGAYLENLASRFIQMFEGFDLVFLETAIFGLIATMRGLISLFAPYVLIIVEATRTTLNLAGVTAYLGAIQMRLGAHLPIVGKRYAALADSFTLAARNLFSLAGSMGAVSNSMKGLLADIRSGADVFLWTKRAADLESEYTKALRERISAAQAARAEADIEWRKGKEAEAVPVPGTAEYAATWQKAYKERLELAGYTQAEITLLITKAAEKEARIKGIQEKHFSAFYKKELAKQHNDYQIEFRKRGEISDRFREKEEITGARYWDVKKRLDELGALDSLSKTEKNEQATLKVRLAALKKQYNDEKKLRAEHRKKFFKWNDEWIEETAKRDKSAQRAGQIAAWKVAEEEEKQISANRDRWQAERESKEREAFTIWRANIMERVQVFKRSLKDMETEYKSLQEALKRLDEQRRNYLMAFQDRVFEYNMSKTSEADQIEKRMERIRYYRRRTAMTQDMEERRSLLSKAQNQVFTLLEGNNKLTDQQRRNLLRQGLQITRAGVRAFEQESSQTARRIETLKRKMQSIHRQIKALYDFVKKQTLDIRDGGSLAHLNKEAEKLLTTLRKIRREGGMPPGKAPGLGLSQSRQSGGWVGSGRIMTRLHQDEFVVRREAAMHNARLLEGINSSRGPVTNTSSMEGTFNFPNVATLDNDTVRSMIVPELERLGRRRLGR